MWYSNQKKASKGQTTSQGSVDTQSAFSEDLDLITGDEPSQSKITSVENADVDPFPLSPPCHSQGGNLLKCIKLKFVPVFDLVIIGSRTGAEAGSSGTGAGAGSSGIMS